MTDAQPALGEPRWHADPEGGAGLRWWDGTQWTSAVMAPEDLAAPAQPRLPEGTPVYTVPLWAIVLLPALSTVVLLQTLDSATLLRNALNILIFGVTIALAHADYRSLLAAGYQRPFHWGWAFLSAGVYVVGRSIIVQRRIGRGLTPIWVWAIVTVLGLATGVWVVTTPG